MKYPQFALVSFLCLLLLSFSQFSRASEEGSGSESAESGDDQGELDADSDQLPPPIGALVPQQEHIELWDVDPIEQAIRRGYHLPFGAPVPVEVHGALFNILQHFPDTSSPQEILSAILDIRDQMGLGLAHSILYVYTIVGNDYPLLLDFATLMIYQRTRAEAAILPPPNSLRLSRQNALGGSEAYLISSDEEEEEGEGEAPADANLDDQATDSRNQASPDLPE